MADLDMRFTPRIMIGSAVRLGSDAARRAQILTARRAYRRHFGYSPKGFWLPECGYEQGLDGLLAEAGFTHFFLESTSLLLGRPEPAYGTRLPVRTPGMNPSQIPEEPRSVSGFSSRRQPLNSPITLTRSAFGAQTAKKVPSRPLLRSGCAPSRW